MEHKTGQISILDMCMGAIRELVDYDAARVMENILDANTDAAAKRKITLTIEFVPDGDRQTVSVQASSKVSLAPTHGVATNLAFVGDENGEMQLVEMLPQVPGQMNLDGQESARPKVLRLEVTG